MKMWRFVGRLGVALAVLAAYAVAGGAAAAGPMTGRVGTGMGITRGANWSGYAAYGTSFTDVKGTWVQPAADCSAVKATKTTSAAFWVGLDGYVSPTVEQTGTEAVCSGTTPVYFAWYEFYPAGVVVADPTTHPVGPGDTLTAEVAQNGSTVTTTLSSSRGWTYTAIAAATGLAFSSAEWITEAASSTFTNFGSVGFSSATASDASNSPEPIGSWDNDRMMLVRGSGRSWTAAAGSLRGAGSSFTITWSHS
jgi:hypothetical protein